MSVTNQSQPNDSILRQHQALLAVSEVIAAQRDLASLFRGLAQHLKTIVEFDVVATVLYDPVQNLMRIQMRESTLLENVPLPPGIPIEASPSGWVMQAQEPLIIPDTETEERFPELVKLARESGMRSYCFLPLTTAGRQLGALGFGRVKPSAFHEADLEFLQQVANQVAVAVENAQNFESARQAEKEIRRQLEREHLMLEINNAVVAKLNLPDLLVAISASLHKVLSHDFAGMALYEAETGQLRVQALDYKRNQEIFGTTDLIPLKGTGAGKAFTSRKPVLLRHLKPIESSVEMVQRVIAAGLKSSCHVPLISRDRVLGTLDVMSFREDAFTDEDVELLTQIGQQIAIAVENALNFERACVAEQELARKLDHLRLMLNVTNTVVSQLDLRELLNVISSSINEVMGADTSGIGLYDEERGQLFAYATDFGSGPGFPIPMEGSTGGRAFTSGQPVFLDKPDLVRFNSDFTKRIYEEGYRSGGSIPLIAHGRKLGVLGVASKREYAFSDEDKALLVQVANQVAIAVDNALNFERARKAEQEIRRKFERERLMLEINNAVVSHLSLRDLVQVTAAYLRDALGHEIVGFSLYDSDTRQLRTYAYDAPGKQFGIEKDLPVPLEGSLGGRAFTSGQPVFFNHLTLNDVPTGFSRQFVEAGVQSGGCIPLVVQGRKLGVMGLWSFREDAFPEDQQELLGHIANQIAIAVDNALNFERARKAEQEVQRKFERERLMLEINNAVVSILDLGELVKTVSASLRDIMPHDAAGIALYEPELSHLREYSNVIYKQVDAFREGDTIPLEGTPAGQVFRTGQPLLVRRPNLAQYPADRYSQRPVEGSPKSACLAPLIAHGKTLGIAGVSSTQEERFTEKDLELFSQIADQIAIAVENALAYREIEALKNKLTEEKLYLEEEINTAYNFEEVIGSSPALKRILKQVATVAPTDSTVLIQGETGTGKELIARAIHNLSARRDRTLVKLNCAAIPSGLLESELFGHERGAFTGAIAQRIGRFELAHKGTLFLDEVGEIPLDLQPKLLRVLQEQEFERLGNARTQRVDVRLIAATNRDLASMSAENKFRSDLFYRLNVFPITIPPLRERHEDIPVLVRFFANKFAMRMKKQIKTIPADAVAALQHYSWPGNIRELENMIERAVILTQGTELNIPMPEINLLAKAAVATADAVPASVSSSPSSPSSASLEAIEREHILRVLNETNWTVGGPNGAAARLGMKRTTLQARMKKLGITRR